MMTRSYHRWIVWSARGIAGAVLFIACATWASAADEAVRPTASTAGKPASVARSAATPTVSSTSSTGAPPVKVICLQNSIRCFSVTSAAPGSPARPALDLRAPDIRRIFTPAELQQTLQEPDEELAAQETVQVQGQRQLAPVSVGIMAIPWAIIHPTQAWRILMPLPDAK
jgi:hypothetical protein